jgi:hypothetical protein
MPSPAGSHHEDRVSFLLFDENSTPQSRDKRRFLASPTFCERGSIAISRLKRKYDVNLLGCAFQHLSRKSYESEPVHLVA